MPACYNTKKKITAFLSQMAKNSDTKLWPVQLSLSE